MGTNYYVDPSPPCPCCGRQDAPLHIGKSSFGWTFALHVYPELGINTLADWIMYWQDKRITDEYGRYVTKNDILAVIVNRTHTAGRDKVPFGYSSLEDMLSRNHAEWGPNNLLRSVVDGQHCIGHGAGTYDYFINEFS